MIGDNIRVSGIHGMDSNQSEDVNITRKRPRYTSTEYEEHILSSTYVGVKQHMSAAIPTPFNTATINAKTDCTLTVPSNFNNIPIANLYCSTTAVANRRA